MKNKQQIVLYLIISLLFFNCSNNNDDPTIALGEELLISSFSVQTPENWEWEEDQGIDTFIGRIFNDEHTIYFDQGYLSFGNLDRVQESDRTISFQRLAINGVPAIIEKEKTSEEEIGREVRLSVYLDEGEGERQNRLYTYDPMDENLIVSIFKSHRFIEN